MKLLAVECSHRSKVKDAAFKNTAYLLMANEKLDNLQQLIIQTEKCNLKRSIKNEINLALINHYIAKKRPRSAENALERSEREIKDYSELIVASDRIEKLYLAEGNKEKASYLKSKKYYYFKKARKKDLDLVSMDAVVEKELETLYKTQNLVLAGELAFPQAKFDSMLKSKLAALDRLTNQAKKLEKFGSGYGVLESLNILYTTYTELVHQVDSFVPQGKSPEFVSSFKKAMKDLTLPLNKTANSFQKEAIKIANDKKVLNYKTFELLKSNHKNFAPRYWTKKFELMDRKGY
jgi:hypothetical protein